MAGCNDSRQGEKLSAHHEVVQPFYKKLMGKTKEMELNMDQVYNGLKLAFIGILY